MEQVKFLVLNRLLHEVLGHASTKILTIFFGKVNIFPMLKDYPPKNILYLIREYKYAK
jgi:hypothetical protein